MLLFIELTLNVSILQNMLLFIELELNVTIYRITTTFANSITFSAL